MNVFISYFQTRFNSIMIYRSAAIFGSITQIFWGFFRIFILYQFTLGNIGESPMASSSMITYIWLNQIFFAIVPWNVNHQEFDLVKSGNVVYELARPINLFNLLFSKTLAWRLASSVIRMIPILIFVIIVLPLIGFGSYGIAFPSIESIFLFIVSISLSYLLSSVITVFIYAITFFTIEASNFVGFINTMAYALSGLIIPLAYFPEKIQTFLNFQPYKSVLDTPAMIFTAEYSVKESMMYILVQVAWVVFFTLINQVMIKKGIKQLVVQGG
ncbi:ABC-2 family transporter protein [Paenibacillus sp. FSL H7-0716]|uniref:ABC transporter permease n=1 Tax=Paenibacillus odorifer TaxID=189426 RepID=A0AB36JM53_9BACL|nr:ABC-2 family transporter protein [Paenibacillus odorifer]OME23549.1 hypothetical protein BSK47_03595 [Paenibacillus odorifer]